MHRSATDSDFRNSVAFSGVQQPKLMLLMFRYGVRRGKPMSKPYLYAGSELGRCPVAAPLEILPVRSCDRSVTGQPFVYQPRTSRETAEKQPRTSPPKFQVSFQPRQLSFILISHRDEFLSLQRTGVSEVLRGHLPLFALRVGHSCSQLCRQLYIAETKAFFREAS